MSTESYSAVILGGGLTGLSAAHRLEQEDYDYHLFEAEDRVGGLCKSVRAGEFTFDYTGHLLHFADPSIEKFVRSIVPARLERQERRAWIHTDGRYTRYPFQRNLYGLPDEVVRECIVDYVEAQLSSGSGASRDFESWLLATFGRGIAKHFMIPYNRKLWLTELSELTLDWIGRFVPDTNPIDMIRGAFSPSSDEVGYNATFLYPEGDGIEVLPNSLAAHLSKLRCNARAVRIDLKNRVVHFKDGSSCRYSSLLSTIPLPVLLSLVDPLPTEVEECRGKLRYISVLDVNLGLDIGDLTDKHWIYVPDAAIPFYRLGFPCNFSSSLAPSGATSVYAEISYCGNRAWNEADTVRDVLEGMNRMGFSVRERDVQVVNVIDMEYAYVLYDFERERCLASIRKFLDKNDIRNVGRFGAWAYLSMEDSIRDGFTAAEGLLQ